MKAFHEHSKAMFTDFTDGYARHVEAGELKGQKEKIDFVARFRALLAEEEAGWKRLQMAVVAEGGTHSASPALGDNGATLYLNQQRGSERGYPVRLIYMLAGLLMTAVGIVGIFLPLLPTTPFLLIAVWCFSRSSPRLEHWLLSHRTLGPPLANWRREGAISARTKFVAISLIVASYGFFYYRTQPSLLLATVVGLILSASAFFILTRPLPRKEAGE